MCYLYSMVYVYLHSVLWRRCVISLWTFLIVFHLSQQLYCDRLIMVFFLFIKFESLVHFELWVTVSFGRFSAIIFFQYRFWLIWDFNYSYVQTLRHIQTSSCVLVHIFSLDLSSNLRILSSSVSNLMLNILTEFFISIIVFLQLYWDIIHVLYSSFT